MVKFIKYITADSLCHGILILSINNTVFKFGNMPVCDFHTFWSSGGYVDFDTGERKTAPWKINKYNKEAILSKFNQIFDKPYDILNECLSCMNENVEYGCCGECL